MTNQDFDKIFTELNDVKGIPGTKMEFFLQDFKKHVKQLMQRDDVQITHLHIKKAKENNHLRFIRLENRYKITIDQEIQSLYQQINHLQLRWIHKNHPKFNNIKDSNFTTEAFENSLLDTEMGSAKYINISHFKYFLEKWPQVYIDFKETEGYQLYYLNYDHHFSGQLAINLNSEKKCLELYTGDDYFAEVKKLNISFPEYMYKIMEINDDIITAAAQE